MREEFLHVDLADEAQALTVFFLGSRKLELFSQFSDLGLLDIAYGKERMSELLLSQSP